MKKTWTGLICIRIGSKSWTVANIAKTFWFPQHMWNFFTVVNLNDSSVYKTNVFMSVQLENSSQFFNTKIFALKCRKSPIVLHAGRTNVK